jgi:adenosylcobinamide kinase/adenosylcobinamide-phosphate guanylyltransferase
MITLVLGGARSGKSRYAQQIAERAATVLYVATAEARDDAEMRTKIARHRADRPDIWRTEEEPVQLARVIRDAREDLVLVDCLTIFAANLLERFGERVTVDHEEVAALCDALCEATCDVVMVSNETGSGVVPEYALGRRYRDLLGEINQQIAAVSGNVVYMVAGLPLLLKGELAR